MNKCDDFLISFEISLIVFVDIFSNVEESLLDFENNVSESFGEMILVVVKEINVFDCVNS